MSTTFVRTPNPAIGAICAAVCRPNRQRTVAAAFLALGAMACQPDDSAEGRQDTQPRDSAGIRVVENARPPDGSRLGWRIGPGPTVSIGEREGEDPTCSRVPRMRRP